MTYDQWKTDPDWGRSYQEEEDEQNEYDIQFMDWVDELLQQHENAAPFGTFVSVGPYVIEVEIGDRKSFWSTCVLPASSDVAMEQWLRF